MELTGSTFIPFPDASSKKPPTYKYTITFKDTWYIPHQILHANVNEPVVIYSPTYQIFNDLISFELGLLLNSPVDRNLLPVNTDVHIFLKAVTCKVSHLAKCNITVLELRNTGHGRQSFHWNFENAPNQPANPNQQADTAKNPSTTSKRRRSADEKQEPIKEKEDFQMTPLFPLFPKVLLNNRETFTTKNFIGTTILFECVLLLPPGITEPNNLFSTRETLWTRNTKRFLAGEDLLRPMVDDLNHDVVVHVENEPNKVIKAHQGVMRWYEIGEIIGGDQLILHSRSFQYIYDNILTLLRYMYHRMIPTKKEINTNLLNNAWSWQMIRFLGLCPHMYRTPLINEVAQLLTEEADNRFKKPFHLDKSYQNEADIEEDFNFEAPDFYAFQRFLFFMAASNVDDFFAFQNESKIPKVDKPRGIIRVQLPCAKKREKAVAGKGPSWVPPVLPVRSYPESMDTEPIGSRSSIERTPSSELLTSCPVSPALAFGRSSDSGETTASSVYKAEVGGDSKDYDDFFKMAQRRRIRIRAQDARNSDRFTMSLRDPSQQELAQPVIPVADENVVDMPSSQPELAQPLIAEGEENVVDVASSQQELAQPIMLEGADDVVDDVPQGQAIEVEPAAPQPAVPVGFGWGNRTETESSSTDSPVIISPVLAERFAFEDELDAHHFRLYRSSDEFNPTPTSERGFAAHSPSARRDTPEATQYSQSRSQSQSDKSSFDGIPPPV